MANERATAKDAQYMLISLLPDVCRTPTRKSKPVPYPVVHLLDQSQQCSPNVFFEGQSAYLHEESYVDNVRGDEAGTGKGIVSNSHVEISRSIEHSESVFINGNAMVRTGDKVWMNRASLSLSNEALAKKARWEFRIKQWMLVKRKLDQMPDGERKRKLQAAADRFEANNVAVEKARLSAHIYDPSQPVPVGWTDISQDRARLSDFDLAPGDLSLPNSNFRAGVYAPEPQVFGESMSTTVVFKGTQNGEDWINNGNQGLDIYSPYYEQAVFIGRRIKPSTQPQGIAGHSLGGGLATAAAIAGNKPATTFNAAGLNSNTVSRYGGTLSIPRVTAYRVDGELLTMLQESPKRGITVWTSMLESMLSLMPKAYYTESKQLPGAGMDPIKRHGMDQVIAGLEAQKDEDLQTMADFLSENNWEK